MSARLFNNQSWTDEDEQAFTLHVRKREKPHAHHRKAQTSDEIDQGEGGRSNVPGTGIGLRQKRRNTA